ncbi:Ig-like domain-containing protein [Oceanirhabdus seepicola]|uniref:SbsA Ig-like domain-containing protein n=1 Tax=Oceanirhabdus seepicola TaxID=2828781 RepID=A0A9J6PAD0_9CLOT|nr:Ig-like domain-containing protein [Oceanirhabdus seepicola]MCM1992325.1 hypothetical protein [Oceanirhabdus seepicola]
MKKIIKILAVITFVLLSIYVVINLNNKYQNFIIEAETMDDYGTWYVKFEYEVNLDNIRNSIKIIDENGKLKEITLGFSDESRQSIVIKPKEEYEINKKYKLIIDDIYNKNNIKINNYYSQEFNVNMKPLEVLNPIIDEQYKIKLIFNQPIIKNDKIYEAIKVIDSKEKSLGIEIDYVNNSDKELSIKILDNLIPKEEYSIVVKGEIISVYDNIMLNGINQKFTVEKIKLDKSLGLGTYESDRKSIDTNYEWYIDQGNTGEYSENNSGPAVAVMAKKWLNKDLDISVKRSREIYYPGGDEWFLVTLIDFFNEFSVPASVSENVNKDDIKKQIDDDNIVIAYIDPKYIPYETDEDSHVNRYKLQVKKHYIIIKGYIVVDDKLYYEVYDPYNFGSVYKDGKPKGKDRFYYEEDLINSIKNTWDNIVIISSE